MMTRNKMIELQWRDTPRMHYKPVVTTRQDLVDLAMKAGRELLKATANIAFGYVWFSALAPLRPLERTKVVRDLTAEQVVASAPRKSAVMEVA